jgi:hypothetical protein
MKLGIKGLQQQSLFKVSFAVILLLIMLSVSDFIGSIVNV